MLPRTTSIWQRDSQPNASGKPGAVQFQESSRRIDLLGRTIADLGSATASLSAYLSARRTATASALAERPVYVLYPQADRGQLNF